jgi:putative transposase
MAVTPKSSWPWVRTLLHSVYDQPDADSVAAQDDRIIDALSDKLPKVAEHPDAARADLLAFTTFPKQIWRHISRTTPRSGSTRRSGAEPTWSASSPTATP